MRIAHISDIHFGKIEEPTIVDALVDEINGLGVDLVAVSGDLTQRARLREYEAARAMLEAFRAPTLVVPGNHDVYPWWRPVKRIFRPLDRYTRYVTDDLAPTFVHEDVAVLGVNSAYGRTIKGGRIGSAMRERVQSFFGDLDDSVFQVLVLHHHLTKIKALGSHDVARKAQKTLQIASEVGVDLILCGHLHVSHIEPVEIVDYEHRVIVASAGTATSTRGRGTNRETNFYNVIEVDEEKVSLDERKFDPQSGRFFSDCQTSFPRTERS